MHKNVLKIDLRNLPPLEAVRILSAIRDVTQKLEKQGFSFHTSEKQRTEADIHLSMCFDDF